MCISFIWGISKKHRKQISKQAELRIRPQHTEKKWVVARRVREGEMDKVGEGEGRHRLAGMAGGGHGMEGTTQGAQVEHADGAGG